jgi:hypothetical protein
MQSDELMSTIMTASQMRSFLAIAVKKVYSHPGGDRVFPEVERNGAGEGNRTPTNLRSSDFESDASTSSTTPATVADVNKGFHGLQVLRELSSGGLEQSVMTATPFVMDSSPMNSLSSCYPGW